MNLLNAEPLLLTIAKIGVALAGFASVVAAIRPRDQNWTLQDVAGLKLMLEHFLAAILFGMVPSGLHLLQPDEGTLWATASLFLGIFLLTEVLLQVNRIRANSQKGAPPRLPKLFVFLWLSPTVGAIALQFANVVTWAASVSYVVGLIWLLVAGCIQFLLFMRFFEQFVERNHATRQ